MSERVRVTYKDGATRDGHWNGKTYNGSIYITPTGYRSGIRVDMTQVASVDPIIVERINPVQTTSGIEQHAAHSGLCPICHTHCYGDCQAANR